MSGDGVKTVIHDKALGELIPAAAEVISKSVRMDCDMLSARRNSEQWPIGTSDGG